MIHLDTSFLIRALRSNSAESKKLVQWFAAKEPLAVSAVVWFEFLIGPPGLTIDKEEERMARLMVEKRILPVTDAVAKLAAHLYNSTGRRRGLVPDCLIAATAIMDDAPLATANPKNFETFRPAGLSLIGNP